MILNITHMGESHDYMLGDVSLDDADVRRVAVELLLVAPNTFDLFVVDRALDGRVYLRPKVPFGTLYSPAHCECGGMCTECTAPWDIPEYWE